MRIFQTVLIFAIFAFAMGSKADPKGQPIARESYMPCIKAINEKSVLMHNRITPLSDDGWSFVVKNDDGSMQVVDAENGIYNLTKDPAKCVGNRTVSSAEEISRLVTRTTASSNDPKNSAENKKEIFNACKYIVGATNMMKTKYGAPIAGFTPYNTK